MNSFYEFFRDNTPNVYVQVNKNPEFPSHFHGGIEVFILKKGFFSVTVNDESIKIKSGAVVVFDSYEVHSYDLKQDDEISAVVLIPYEFRKFILPSEKHKILNHVIEDEKFADMLFDLVNTFLIDNPKSVQNGAIALICSLLKEKLSFTTQAEKGDADLLKKVLIYISENYQSDVSRKKVAMALGYSESYISHVFNGYLKTSITEFVNVLRLRHVENEIKNGNNQPISTLLFEAGFKSQHTYYRVKSKLKSN